jgi:hypothetical protein
MQNDLSLQAPVPTSASKYRARMAQRKRRYEENDENQMMVNQEMMNDECPSASKEEVRGENPSSVHSTSTVNGVGVVMNGTSSASEDLKLAAQIGEKLLEENAILRKRSDLLQEECRMLKGSIQALESQKDSFASRERSVNHMERKIERLKSALSNAEEQVGTLTSENGSLLSERNSLKNQLEKIMLGNDEALTALRNDKLVEVAQLSNQHKKEVSMYNHDALARDHRIVDSLSSFSTPYFCTLLGCSIEA